MGAVVGVGDGLIELVLVEVIVAESGKSPLNSSEEFVGSISLGGGVDDGTTVADLLDGVVVTISFTGVDEMHLTATIHQYSVIMLVVKNSYEHCITTDLELQ